MREETLQVLQVGGLEVDDDMPAQRRDLRARWWPGRPSGRYSTRRLRKLNRTPRTPASSSRRSSVSVMSGRTVAMPRARPSADWTASTMARVVGSVAGRLYDDVAADPQTVAQREELVLARITRGVLAFRRERELGGGAEDMAVGVDRSGRQSEARRRRVLVPVQPARGLGCGRLGGRCTHGFLTGAVLSRMIAVHGWAGR